MVANFMKLLRVLICFRGLVLDLFKAHIINGSLIDLFILMACQYIFVTVPPRPPRYINFFELFLFTAGDQLVVPIGASHISLPLQEIQSREREKKKKNKRTICLGQFKCKRGVMQHSISCVHM